MNPQTDLRGAGPRDLLVKVLATATNPVRCPFCLLEYNGDTAEPLMPWNFQHLHDCIRTELIRSQVDGKVRSGKKGGLQEGTPLIVGWDAAGIVEETGPETSLFKKGDEVFFAGSINRPGMLLHHHILVLHDYHAKLLSFTSTPYFRVQCRVHLG